jgi:ssDNA-binding replication factor A large subunit
MISMPYEEIIKTIVEKNGISKEELEVKIKQKLDQLSGLISKEGAAHIIANELGIRVFEKLGGKLKINEIHTGMRDVETVAKVTRKYEVREFTTKAGSKGKVGAIVISDETGFIRVVLWNDQADLMEKFNEGDILRIIGAQARANQDRKELHLSTTSKVVINPPGEKVDVEVPEKKESSRKQISELTGDEQEVEIKSTIVQIFDIRFYEVCPQCNRRILQKDDGFYCNTHGKVEPKFSYALTFVGDDGSDNIRIVCFGNQVEQFLKKSAAEVQGFKDHPEEFEEVKNSALGNIVLLNGRVNKNEMFNRMDFIARNVKYLDIEQELKIMRGKKVDEKVEASPVVNEKPVVSEQPVEQPVVEEKPVAETPVSEEVSSDEATPEPSPDPVSEKVEEPVVSEEPAAEKAEDPSFNNEPEAFTPTNPSSQVMPEQKEEEPVSLDDIPSEKVEEKVEEKKANEEELSDDDLSEYDIDEELI